MLQNLSHSDRCFSAAGHTLSSSLYCIDPSTSNSSSCSTSNSCDNNNIDIGNESSCANLKPKSKLEEPGLVKLKRGRERDPDKRFELLKENAHNRLVIEHQKSLPQGQSEGFVVRIIMLAVWKG